MAETRWQVVVEGLELLSSEPTAEQRSLGAAVGCPVSPTTPDPVAAAELRIALRVPLRLALSQRFGSEEYDTLLELAGQTGLTVPVEDEIGSREVLNAWLHVARARQAAAALRRLQPQVDDVAVVRDRTRGPEVHGHIASISASGRINFRGGRGMGAAPHLVDRIVRTRDADYGEMLRLAREYAASRDRAPHAVSHADLDRLEPWRVEGPAPQASIVALRQALRDADGEPPMQKVLQAHPVLLSGLVPGNHGTWVRPEVSFGNHFRADFLVAGRSSLGLRWLLVELESPLSLMANPKDRRATTTLRHAVDQIEDWRAWLAMNLDSARRAREDHGLGLPGITAEAPGLIVMSRADVQDAAEEIRDLKARRYRIEVRTYDWLLRVNQSPNPLRGGVLDVFDDEDDPGRDW